MEKKRHNPIITEEDKLQRALESGDSAVKAFDATPRPDEQPTLKSSLDQEVQQAAQNIAVKKYQKFFEGFALKHYDQTKSSLEQNGLCGVIDQEILDKFTREELNRAGEELNEEKIGMLKEFINYVNPLVRAKNSVAVMYARLVSGYFAAQYTYELGKEIAKQ
ncbi:hypothetical protein HY837_01670, partial [archaeon]|nr:hypothetical protein [archaeon]